MLRLFDIPDASLWLLLGPLCIPAAAQYGSIAASYIIAVTLAVSETLASLYPKVNP